MIKIAYDHTEVHSYNELLDRFSDDALASPKRSTVPLLSLWQWPADHLGSLCRSIGADLKDPVQLAFEYTVPVRQGSGKPSCTDLMISSRDSCVAIEAKFTEPAYPTVQEWLGSMPSANRLAVLAGWLQHISDVVAVPIDTQAILSLPYQMIHRAASACALGRDRAYLVYLLFGALTDYYQEQLARFAALIGDHERLQFRLVMCPLHPLPNFLRLEQAWIAGEGDMGAQVRTALATGVLFQFGAFQSVPLVASRPAAP